MFARWHIYYYEDEEEKNSPAFCIDLDKKKDHCYQHKSAFRHISTMMHPFCSVVQRIHSWISSFFFPFCTSRARYRMFLSDFSCEVLMPPIFMVILDLQEFSKFEYHHEIISFQSAFTRVIFGAFVCARRQLKAKNICWRYGAIYYGHMRVIFIYLFCFTVSCISIIWNYPIFCEGGFWLYFNVL